MGCNVQVERLTSDKTRNSSSSKRRKEIVCKRRESGQWVNTVVELIKVLFQLLLFFLFIDYILPISHCARPQGHKDKLAWSQPRVDFLFE